MLKMSAFLIWKDSSPHLSHLLTLLFPFQFKQFCFNFLSQLLTWDVGFHPLYFFCLYLWLCCSGDPISHCDHENFIIIIIIIISSLSLIHASHLSVCRCTPPRASPLLQCCISEFCIVCKNGAEILPSTLKSCVRCSSSRPQLSHDRETPEEASFNP